MGRIAGDAGAESADTVVALGCVDSTGDATAGRVRASVSRWVFVAVSAATCATPVDFGAQAGSDNAIANTPKLPRRTVREKGESIFMRGA